MLLELYKDILTADYDERRGDPFSDRSKEIAQWIFPLVSRCIRIHQDKRGYKKFLNFDGVGYSAYFIKIKGGGFFDFFYIPNVCNIRRLEKEPLCVLWEDTGGEAFRYGLALLLSFVVKTIDQRGIDKKPLLKLLGVNYQQLKLLKKVFEYERFYFNDISLFQFYEDFYRTQKKIERALIKSEGEIKAIVLPLRH